MRSRHKSLPIIGWREWVDLPDLGLPPIKAKIDTGAQTSCLHALHIRPFMDDGRQYVAFDVHPQQRHRRPEFHCIAPVIDRRRITSSNGQGEVRYVVSTTMHIGAVAWVGELTLTNREALGFRMLIGRQAIRNRFMIDPGRSYHAAGWDITPSDRNTLA